MSYEQLTQAVDNLAVSNATLTQSASTTLEASRIAADKAETASVRATSAADTAQLSAGIYDTTALGLAATTTGKYFSVPSVDSNEYLILYKNNSGVALEVKRYPSVGATTALKNTLPQVSPIGYAWSVFDKLFRAAIGVKDNGEFVATLATIDLLKTTAFTLGGHSLSNRPYIGFKWVVDDSQNRAAIGVKDDGTFVAKTVETNKLSSSTFATLMAEIETLIAINFKVAGHNVINKPYIGYKWVVDDVQDRAAIGVKDDGTFVAKNVIIGELKVDTINGRSYSPGTVSRFGGVYSHDLNYINNLAQSLGEGSTPAVALTTNQEYDNVGFPAHSTNPSTLVPLTVANTQVNTRGESPMYGTLGHIKELIAEENGIDYASNNYQLVACNNGYSGYSILSLNKGTAPYLAALSQVKAAFDIAKASGKTMSYQATTWTQGEANAAMSKDEYKGYLKQLAVDLNVDGKAITGQFNDVKFITYQCASANRNIAVAQLEASNESGLIFMACPMYQFDYGDSQHINAQSSKWLGGYYGLAYKRLIIDRQDWQPLQPVGHNINGNVIDLMFNKTGLVLDTALIPAQVNHGFEVRNAGLGLVTITDVTLLSPNRVRLTLATPPIPGWFVRYGYNSAVGKGPFVGGCGNLRDSQGDTMVYSAINKPMHNWCVIFNYSL